MTGLGDYEKFYAPCPLHVFFTDVAANIGVNVVKAVLDLTSPSTARLYNDHFQES